MYHPCVFIPATELIITVKTRHYNFLQEAFITACSIEACNDITICKRN